MRFLLLLFLISCAVSRPSEYRDGAPVRTPVVPPRIGHTPPGAGLPEYFREPEREPLPRSPHRRPLPPTAEPGIWAGDEPRASVDDDPIPETPILAGVVLPYPPGAESELEKRPTRLCARDMNLAIEALNLKDRVEGLSKGDRTCLAAMLYRECAVGNERSYEDLKTKAVGRPTPGADDRIRANSAVAFDFERRHCPKPPPADASAIAAKVVPIWRQFAGIPELQ